MVPDFPFLPRNAFDRVPVWPRSDMLQCFPILADKDAVRYALHAPSLVPILSRKQVFYDVPIVYRAISESIA